MAKVLLGIGTSHGPQLNTPVDLWHLHVERDRTSKQLCFQGRTYDFEGLAQERKKEHLEKEITPEKMRERYEAGQKGIRTLSETLARVAPDVAVIIGDDQNEVFSEDAMPALSVYCGETVDNVPLSEEQKAKRPRGLIVADWGTFTPEPTTTPCEPELGKHIIQSLIKDEFDPAHYRALPAGRFGTHGIPHAWGFVYRRIMNDKVFPNVPVFINTYYPPNQPTLKRCYDFGKALRRAIESWDSDKTVAVIASGGLSHYVVEEDLDHQVLDAFQKRDENALFKLPIERFESGTSEIRNWIVTAGAMADTELQMELVDYIPCYRSEAGTGCAMGFVQWL